MNNYIRKWELKKIGAVVLAVVVLGSVVVAAPAKQTDPKKLRPGTTEWFEAVESKVHVGDKDEHGPELGSAEWVRAVESKVHVTDKDGTGPDVGSGEWMRAVHRRLFRVEPAE